MTNRFRGQALHLQKPVLPTPESTKGSRSSPLICRCVLFFIIEGRSVVVFGNRGPLPLFLSIPIRDQEQTYFFER